MTELQSTGTSPPEAPVRTEDGWHRHAPSPVLTAAQANSSPPGVSATGPAFCRRRITARSKETISQ